MQPMKVYGKVAMYVVPYSGKPQVLMKGFEELERQAKEADQGK